VEARFEETSSVDSLRTSISRRGLEADKPRHQYLADEKCVPKLLGSGQCFRENDFFRVAFRFEPSRGNGIVKILQTKSSFIVLQVLDLVTTLVAFHFGAFEVNPLVGHLTVVLGPTGGVLCSKVIAVLIAMRVRKLVWVVNLFYVGVVGWNTFVLFALSHARP
jgi:hypothetical protein